MDKTPNNIALYVHWPWCKAKCPYCDFNSKVPTKTPDHDQWLGAYISEMKHFYDLTHTPMGKSSVSSIFFGGGTPSTMAPQTVAGIVGEADRLWGLQKDVEITLEANPTSVETARLRDLAQAGVNRASVGVQSLNKNSLKFLGREHSPDEATSTCLFPPLPSPSLIREVCSCLLFMYK